MFGNIAAEVPTADGGTTLEGWYQVNEFAGGTMSVVPH